MAFFGNSVQPSAPGTTNDVLTLTSANGRRARIVEISVCGLGTSSTANELGVKRPGGVGITPTNQASVPMDPDCGSCSATVATGWTTQPSLGTVAMLRLGCNSNGAIYRWVATPGMEINLRGDSLTSHCQISLRFTTGGAGAMGVGMVFEEI
jgi:hypothetical protein